MIPDAWEPGAEKAATRRPENFARVRGIPARIRGMFTGIVVGRGEVVSLAEIAGAALRMVLDVSVLPREPGHGASVSVSGVCLTVVDCADGRASFDVVGETVRCSTLGEVRVGDRPNLEPPLRMGDELGGHQVQGHVDGVGQILAIERRTDETWMTIQAPPEVMNTLVPKGWVTVDGASLTVADLTERSFSVALIPTTLQLTTLGDARVGTRVNLEGDPLGKHVAHWMATRREPASLLG